DELRDAELEQRRDALFEVMRVAGRVGAADPEMRAAAKMDAAHVVDAERHDVVDVAAHDPLEAVADAEDADAREHAADRGGADDAVDPGRGSAADQDCELRGRGHGAQYGADVAAWLGSPVPAWWPGGRARATKACRATAAPRDPRPFRHGRR